MTPDQESVYTCICVINPSVSRELYNVVIITCVCVLSSRFCYPDELSVD